jgi:hypothetical protein
MKVILMPHIQRKYIIDHQELVFVFGDNDARKGYGGLAKEARGLYNTHGIRVKKYPSMAVDAFYNDEEFEEQKKKIDMDINELLKRSNNFEAVVFPLNGIGTGLADLPHRSWITFEYLCKRLVDIGVYLDKF